MRDHLRIIVGCKSRSKGRSAPHSVADVALAEPLGAEISDADYEAKTVGLLTTSFKAHTAVDPSARDVWRNAFSVLSGGDHYILVMIADALGKHLKP